MRASLPVLLVCLAAATAQEPSTITQALNDLPAGQSVLPEDVLEGFAFHAQEDAGTCQIVKTDQQPPGRAFHIEVLRKTENQWEVGMNCACAEAVEKDDVLLLRFTARTVGSDGPEPGEIHLVFRRKTEPRDYALNEKRAIKGGWREYAVPFSPDASMGKGEALLILNFGMKAQTLEIRDIQLVNFGKEVPLGRLYQALGIKPGSGGRKAVGRPLTPGLLWEMAAYSALPTTEPEFSAGGKWVNTYSIWTCHGYLYHGNNALGYLRLERTPTEPVTLAVEQEIVVAEGIVHRVNAEIRCSDGALASPRSWHIASTYVGPEGEKLEAISTEEDARVNGAVIEIEAGGRTLTRKGSARLAADWCLFDAVQRLAFGADSVLEFDMLEGLSLLKGGHRLSYAGKHEVRLGVDTVALHRFQQIGHGVLPYEYWLDDSHRLMMVVTHSRAYILDHEAQHKHQAYADGQVSSYNRARERNEKAAEQ